jgi:A/G-specific adenine glycosylase
METALQKEKIQSRLLQWFRENGRDLPWRKTQDPYAIWVSEIMLQQTQVDTVTPYYKKYLRTFPTVRHLARASLSEVLKIWEGLGYYSRARNLHRASRIIIRRFQGKIPDTLRDLQSLPGIGRSTAGAILSFAYDQEASILDGNVKRVLSRLAAVSSSKAGDLLWEISESLIPKGHSNPFNQALMDLGSMLCTPRNPQCLHCPLKNLCRGYLSGRPERYPSRMKKKPIPHIARIAAVIQKDEKVLLRQRPLKGLLGGLWEFPNWESDGKRSLRLRLRNYIKREMGIKAEVKDPIGTLKQTFSHFKLTLRVYPCRNLNGKGKGKWVPIKNLDRLAMSRIDRRIANTLRTNN